MLNKIKRECLEIDSNDEEALKSVSTSNNMYLKVGDIRIKIYPGIAKELIKLSDNPACIVDKIEIKEGFDFFEDGVTLSVRESLIIRD